MPPTMTMIEMEPRVDLCSMKASTSVARLSAGRVRQPSTSITDTDVSPMRYYPLSVRHTVEAHNLPFWKVQGSGCRRRSECRMSAKGRGCVKTPALGLHVEN